MSITKKQLDDFSNESFIPEILDNSEKNAITFLDHLFKKPEPTGNGIFDFFNNNQLANKVKICLLETGLIRPCKKQEETHFCLTFKGLKALKINEKGSNNEHLLTILQDQTKK